MKVKMAPWAQSLRGDKSVTAEKYIHGHMSHRKLASMRENMMALEGVCHACAVIAGWWDEPRDAGTMIALIHSEVSEVLEGVRKGMLDEHVPGRLSEEVELADVLIRVLDYAAARRLDVFGAMHAKLLYNAHRLDHKSEARKKRGGKRF